MNRFLTVIGVSLLLTVILGAVAMTSLRSYSEAGYRLAHGRALLDAENYIGALQTLRELPMTPTTMPEAHAYLGAAYFRLHLYEAAIREFQTAVKRRPRGADPWIGLASAYMKLGDAQKAREEAARAAGMAGASADAWIMLGRAWWLEQNLAEAEKAGLKARELAPGSPAVTDLLLHIYSDQNNAAEFQSLLDKRPQLSPPNQDTAVRFYVRQSQFGRAWELKSRFERGSFQRSILEDELALQRDPQAVERYPRLIANLVRTERFEEAIETGNKYRGTVSTDLDMGKAYWMTGQRDLAVRAFTRASQGLVHKLPAEAALAAITGDVRHWREAFRAERIELDYFILARLEGLLDDSNPVVAAFIYRYAALFDPSLYNNAADAALKAIERDPVNLDALITLGTAYQRLNQLDDAVRYLEFAGEEHPENAEIWSRLANLAVQSGDTQKTFTLMQRAADLDPQNAGYLYNFGWLHDQIGNTSEAVKLYESAIRLSPLSFEAMNNLALIYGESGEPDRALRLLEQAVRTDPESEVASFNLASYYVRRREWTQALRHLEQVLRINPANTAAGIEKGRIQLETARTDDAIETLNQVLDADAHSESAYLLLSSAYQEKGHTHEAEAARLEAQRARTRRVTPQ
jgi:tetratricopeptide (TPR) repeat protein